MEAGSPRPGGSKGARSESRPRAWRAAVVIALVAGTVGVFLSHWPPAEVLENSGFDTLFQIRGPRPEPPGVCVVALDDASYIELGVSPLDPWPRSLHADLIRTLAREGARAVAFDVLFDTPREPIEDTALESALRDTGIVVLGSTVEQVEDPRFRQARLIEPIPEFAAVAAEVAEVNLPTDGDGVIRRTWLTHLDRPSLALGAYQVAMGLWEIPPEGARLVDYYGPPRTIRTVSVYQALDPEQFLPDGFFQDKIVFVGLSQPVAAGPAAKDAFLTPFRGPAGISTFGVEIHATVAANLLEGRHLKLLSPLAEGLWLFLLPLAAALCFVSIRPLWGAAALVGLELVPWTVATLAFTQTQIWIPVIIPAFLQLPLVYVLTLIWYYLSTVREREKIKRAFSFYLSPEMIRKIAADPDSLNLGGEEIVATGFFTDIKGFTSIAENMTAPETAGMLNDYFSEVTSHIFEAGGTLIKYIGDAVFAIWGAPLRREDHAAAACRAALALARAEAAARENPENRRVLTTRVGLHTGSMLVGNLGSAQRFDYTAIGDAVNLAARLEGLNKAVGTQVLISGETYSQAGKDFVVRSLGRARVVGRSEPVALYELLGGPNMPSPVDSATLDCFHQALDHFGARRFQEAEKGFKEAIRLRGGSDGPSEFFLGQIHLFTEAPPSEDWDGVVTFVSK